MKFFKILSISFRNNSMELRSKSKKDFEVSDIVLFFQQNSSKADNDKNNKKRELILENIIKLEPKFYEDKEFQKYWVLVKDSWFSTLSKLCKEKFETIIVKQKAGRSFNYDFDVSYESESKKILQTLKIEFKHNSESIEKIPQFLSLTDGTCDFFKESYASFYYDNYLTKYLECDENLKSYLKDSPSKEEYLKLVKKTSYDCHKMFKSMYLKEDTKKEEKFKIVNESISEYLKKYASSINLECLKEKLIVTQKDKYFLLWNLDQFKVQNIDVENINSLKFSSVKNDNTIIIEGKDMKFHLLLRWKNHKGILLPAWQISIKF